MSLVIGKTIGKGGQSEVVKATSNNEEYAIKLYEEDSVFQKELEIFKIINKNDLS